MNSKRHGLAEHEKLTWCLIHQDKPLMDKARQQATQSALNVLQSWARLNAILQRHEECIRKRWLNKTRPEKEAMLREILPSIAARHRPEEDDEDLKTAKSTKLFTSTEKNALAIH